MRYVIIGNSAAGVTAAETLRRLDKNSEITIIDRENTPAYSRCILPNYLEGTRAEEELHIRPKDFYQKLEINTFFGSSAEKIETDTRIVKLTGGKQLPYDRLLIAAGAGSAMPPVPGLDSPGVYGLRNLDDAKNILEETKKARKVLVLGAGFVGLETAAALYKRGLEVTVVEKSPQVLPQQLDGKAALILQRELQAEGLRFILGQGVKQVLPPGLWQKLFGKNGKGIILENGDRLKADLIIAATGTHPNVEFLKDTKLNINNGIVVDNHLQTSISGIYAAGDIAETGAGLTPIWPNATAQGKAAAFNMAGIPRENSEFSGLQNAVEFRNVPAIAVGVTNPSNNNYEIISSFFPDRNLYKKLIFQGDVLKGFILVGDIRQAGIFGGLVKTAKPLGKSKASLMESNFGYGRIYAKAVAG